MKQKICSSLVEIILPDYNPQRFEKGICLILAFFQLSYLTFYQSLVNVDFQFRKKYESHYETVKFPKIILICVPPCLNYKSM